MWIWIVLALGLLTLDQVTKALVNAFLPIEGQYVTIIEGLLRFRHVRNSGAVFGLGGDHGWALYFFIATALIAAILFVVMFIKSDQKNKKLTVYRLALTLLFAGALGNCIDRLFQIDHRVVDFLDFYGIWVYVFNVADMCLTVGIGFFLLDQLVLEPKRHPASAAKKVESEKKKAYADDEDASQNAGKKSDEDDDDDDDGDDGDE
jgi:signal peptidase II